MKTRYRDIPAYITKDGSEIRELLHAFAEFSQTRYRNKDIAMTINNGGVLNRYVDNFKPSNTLTAIGLGWQFD